MTATVDIITNKRSKTVSAPISAIVIKTDTSSVKKSYGSSTEINDDVTPVNEEKFECVFVNENGKAKLRVVKTGIQDDTNIEIISGLKEGDEIIIGPYNIVSKTLKTGDAIEVKGKNNRTNQEEGEVTSE